MKKFSDIAKNTLDEWIYYLKNNKIKDEFTAQGLNKARKILAFDKMTDAEKKAYWRHVEERRIRDSEVETAHEDGFDKGYEKGEAGGLEKGKARLVELSEKIVINSNKAGLSPETISTLTGLTPAQINYLNTASSLRSEIVFFIG